MKLDWQHVVLILLAVTSAASPFASQAAHGQPIDTGALVAAAFALVTTIGALLKASIVPSVNTSAAVKTATDAALKVAAGAFLALCFVGCASAMPQTACASNPNLTTAAEVDACRAAARDAGPPQAVVVVASKDGGK